MAGDTVCVVRWCVGSSVIRILSSVDVSLVAARSATAGPAIIKTAE